MIQYISTVFGFLFIIVKFLMFSYVFHPLYLKCNVQKKIKKDNKIKIICKPKSLLLFIYFALLCLLFKLFTFKVINFLLVAIFFGFLVLYDKFSPNFSNALDKYNKMSIVIIFWKLFHSIFTIIFLCTEPINRVFNNFLKKKISQVKKLVTAVANLEGNSFEDKNIDEINRKLNLKNNEDEMSKMSNISQYLINSSKSTNKSSKNLKKSKLLNTIGEKTDDSNELIELNENNLNSNSHNHNSQNENSNDQIESNSQSKSYSVNSKEEIIEKLNNINNIFANDNINEIEDISYTISPN
jgi:hypothetical protein